MPGDLPVEELLDHLRLADPVRLRENPIFLAFGVGQAVVLTRELAERAELDRRRARHRSTCAEPSRRRSGTRRPVSTRWWRPALRRVPLRPEQNLAVWRSQYGRPLPIVASTRVARRSPGLRSPPRPVASSPRPRRGAPAVAACSRRSSPPAPRCGPVTGGRRGDRRRSASSASPARLAAVGPGWVAPRAPGPHRSAVHRRRAGPTTTPPTWPAASTGSSVRGATTVPCAAAGPIRFRLGPPT